MKIDTKLAEVALGSQGRLTLHEHDGAFCIRQNGQGLMHSKLHASEITLGELACELLREKESAKILIGGLGLGFTLKAVLKNTQPSAQIDLYELIPDVVEWNRTYLKQLNGHLLEDPRVNLHVGDVMSAFSENATETYDAIILDIDNGPAAMVSQSNSKVYRKDGLAKIYHRLTANGRVAVWSAQEDDAFKSMMGKCGFDARLVRAKTHATAKSYSYAIYVGDKR
jgi:spermidine synthase